MEDRELNLDELENVHVSPDNKTNYENTMNNKDLYRQKQIQELESLKDKILNDQENTRKNTR